MRILRISLRNIASLAGTHTVDFTLEPLRSAGLFSISGPTGSGKSSLLDALCLALYDDTPRLHTIGRLAELANGEKQNDPRNLLRRGSGEGFAEVAFAGVDNVIYTARWNARRSRNKADGTLQQTEMAIFRGDVPPGAEGTLEQGGRKTEVLPVIASKVGLTFDQFTRAVLLAQNDFATFLKADDRERAEILQALTGTRRFEAISIAVFERCAAEQKAVCEIENRLAGNAPLTPETRAEAEAALSAAESALKEIESSLAASEQHAAWFAQMAKLSHALAEAEVTLRAAEASRDAAAPRRAELEHTGEAARDARPLRDAEAAAAGDFRHAEINRSQKTGEMNQADAGLEARKRSLADAVTAFSKAKLECGDARPLLHRARDIDSRLTPLVERCDKAKREREAAAEVVNGLQTKRDALVLECRQNEALVMSLEEQRAVLAPFEGFATDAAAWLDRLDSAAAAGRTMASAAAELARLAHEEKRQLTGVAAERENEPALRAAAAGARKELEAAEAAAKIHDSEKIAAGRCSAENARKALSSLQSQLREMQTLTSQCAALSSEMGGLEGGNEADAKAVRDLRGKEIPNAEKNLAGAREAYEQAAAAVDAATVRLRESLRSGAPCPVCGALDHPYGTHPPAEDAVALRALKKGIVNKERTCQALRGQLAGLEAGVLSRAGQIAEKSKKHHELQHQLESARSIRHDHAEAAAILSLPEVSRLPAVTDRLSEIEEQQRQLEAADAARRAADKYLGESRAKHDGAAQDLAAWEKRLGELDKGLSLAKAARNMAQASMNKATGDFKGTLAALEPLFAAIPSANSAFCDDAAAFRDSFAASCATVVASRNRLTELTGLIGKTSATLGPVEEALVKAGADLTERQADEASAVAAHGELLQQRAELFGGRPADAVEAELNEALARAAKAQDDRAKELADADKHLAAAAEALKSADVGYATAVTRHASALAAMDLWLDSFAGRTGRTLDRPGLDALLARDHAWLTGERAALDALESAVKTAEGALNVHRESLTVHIATRPTEDDEATVAAALAEYREARTAVAERCDAARAVILNDDQRRRENAEFAAQLSARQAKADPWVKLNDLIGSADGAKFRSIAQRRTLDILLGYANCQLDQLAARYRLERLPQSLNLIVLDRDMGDERRSVHSLSGGESFLVSLALALGLASLTSNRLRIESLFIDEGFGSLDAETLNTAMGALMQLESQGRKVGVISHVAEMADAIPVQIRVVKGRSGASRLVIPGMAEAPPGAESVETANPGRATSAAGRKNRAAASGTRPP